jgi:hypothetical protein
MGEDRPDDKRQETTAMGKAKRRSHAERQHGRTKPTSVSSSSPGFGRPAATEPL